MPLVPSPIPDGRCPFPDSENTLKHDGTPRLSGHTDMADAADELKALEGQALTHLQQAADEAALRSWNTTYFGDKGLVKAALGKLGSIPKDQKPAYGAEVNRVKTALTAEYDKKLAEVKEASLQAS